MSATHPRPWSFSLAIATFAIAMTCLVYSTSPSLRVVVVAIAMAAGLNHQRRRAHAILEGRLVELEARRRMTAQLCAMSDRLLEVSTCHEAYAVIADSAQRLFPGDAGALFIDRSNATPGVVASWGKAFAFPVFAPIDCLALGEVGDSDRHAQGCRSCHRSAPTTAAAQTCFPASSRHGPTSIACFRWQPITRASGRDASSIARLRVEQATAFAKQIGLALTSVRLKEQLREQALRDPLTGLHNRRFLEEVFPRDLLRAARDQGTVGILMLDLDDFKAFNDAHGHPAGDTLLKAAAARIRSMVRAADVACRYGGEEFILILPDATVDDASALAEQIRAAIGELTIDIEGVPTPSVTISIGVAASPRNGQSAAALVRAADSALYAAKSNGRNRTEVAIPVLTTTPSRRSSARDRITAPGPASVVPGRTSWGGRALGREVLIAPRELSKAPSEGA